MFAAVLQRFSFVGWLRYWLFDRNYNRTVKVLLVAVCLIFTVVSTLLIRDIDLSSFNSMIISFLPILLLVLLTVALLMYRYMEGTALFIFFMSTLVNDGVSTGTDTKLTFTFLSLLLLAGVWLFKRLIVQRSFKVLPSSANVPIVLFIVVVIIAYIWSGAFSEEAASYLFAKKSLVRLMTALVLIISPLTYIMFSNVIRSEKAIKLMVWWFVGFGLVTGLMRITLGTVVHPLNVKGQFPTWVCALAIGQFFFNTSLRWYVRVALLLVVAIWIRISLGLGLSWLSGWVPIIVVLGCLVTFYSRKLLFIGLLGVVIWGAANADFVNHTFAGEQSESGNTRATAWARAFGVVGKHFLFGAGPAGYEYYFQSYGYYDVGVGLTDLSHNNYIDIIAQTGVVGFSLWILMWAGQGWMIWKLYWKRIDDPFFSATRYALVACYPAILITMMLGDWVTPFPYTQTLAGIDYTIWSWMFSGVSIALYYWLPVTSRESKELELSIPASPTVSDVSL